MDPTHARVLVRRVVVDDIEFVEGDLIPIGTIESSLDWLVEAGRVELATDEQSCGDCDYVGTARGLKTHRRMAHTSEDS